MVGQREMRQGRRAIEYLEVCRCAPAKSSIKILVHFPSSFRILAQFFWFTKNPGSFFRINQNPGSFSRFNQNHGSFSRLIQNPGSFSRFIQNPTSISTCTNDCNILAHPCHFHFYVSTRPKSTHLLEQNILAHPRFLHFYIHELARPKYSCTPSIPQFLGIYLTERFLLILDTSISTYLLDRNILAHPQHLHFYASTRPKDSCASLTPPFLRICSKKIFLCTLDTSISMYLLDQNIPAYPRHLHFFESTWPKYSIHIYSTIIFLLIGDTSILFMYLLYQNKRTPEQCHWVVWYHSAEYRIITKSREISDASNQRKLKILKIDIAFLTMQPHSQLTLY